MLTQESMLSDLNEYNKDLYIKIKKHIKKIYPK